MNDELWDEQAYVCTDCLFLIANWDMPDFAYQYPDKSEAEVAEMTRDYNARIDHTMTGYRITLGWGREQHDCATNVTVTALLASEVDGEDYTDGDTKEYRADTVSDAISQAEFDLGFADGDNSITGFRGVAHDLETEGDRGGECYCEEESFAERTCDHCNAHHAGSWHAATVWKITEEENGS